MLIVIVLVTMLGVSRKPETKTNKALATSLVDQNCLISLKSFNLCLASLRSFPFH